MHSQQQQPYCPSDVGKLKPVWTSEFTLHYATALALSGTAQQRHQHSGLAAVFVARDLSLPLSQSQLAVSACQPLNHSLLGPSLRCAACVACSCLGSASPLRLLLLSVLPVP